MARASWQYVKHLSFRNVFKSFQGKYGGIYNMYLYIYVHVHVVRSTHLYTYVTMYIHGVDVLSTPGNRRKKR